MVGASDLIGQMSDRMYLEKCREFLYQEFVLGSVAREKTPDGREIVRYASPEDLIYKTPGFYEYVARERILKKLNAADRYAEAHFDGPSLYQTEIDAKRPIETRIQWSSGGGHMHVIYGYDADRSQVAWGDPWKSTPRYNEGSHQTYVRGNKFSWTHSLYQIGMR